MPDPVWDRYLAEYHDTNPGITEDVLAGALDAAGRSPYDWLLEAVPAGSSTVVDLGCGSSPVARLLPAAGVVGVDRSAGELARARAQARARRATGPSAGPPLLVRALADALPVADNVADAVVSSMALMLLSPLAAVLAEVARVLRPGGAFVATVSARAADADRANGADTEPPFAGILDALGQRATGYPEPLDAVPVADRLSAVGLTLVSDETRLFQRTVAGDDEAALVVRSFYAPGMDRARVEGVIAIIQRQARVAPVVVAYRLRRLVAVR